MILPGGSISDAEIVRVGVFTAVTENFFLKFVPETQSLQVLARQPARRFRSMADDLFELDEGYTAMAVDPSKGQILGLLIQTPGIGERINQGGLPGYIIILIGLLGLAMSLWRMKYLKEEGDAIKPSMVVTNACDIPPAINFGSPVPNRVSAWKVTIIPTTVPKSPSSGATAAKTLIILWYFSS